MSKPFDEENEPTKKRRGLFSSLRASFLTGLVVIAPIALTFWMIWTVAGWVDGWVLPFVPDRWHLDTVLQRIFGDTGWYQWLSGGEGQRLNVRGVGVIFFLLFTIIIGWMAKGLIGRSLITWAEGVVQNLPVVRSIYNGLKQIAETVFAQSETSFDKACLVEYPRKGIWAIAFISTSAKGEIHEKIEAATDKTAVFLPTTPNPTSGFFALRAQSRRNRTRHVRGRRSKTRYFRRPRLPQWR